MCHEGGQRYHHRPHSYICPHVHRRGQAGESVHLHPIWFGKCFPALLNMVKLPMQMLTVVLYSHQNVDCQSDHLVVLRGDESEQGRFGSSLAVLPDINADGLNDLAVGAPLENDGHGSIYIFHGEGMGSMGLTFSQVTDLSINYIFMQLSHCAPKSSKSFWGLSQRILGTQSVKHFGMSISSSAFDHSQDSLPDLVVGSKGNIVFLR